ncbi:MAG: hemerythrin domain-containing protein [Kofleriaceae bacterium]|nr:hemerythrin domain-containing protein [Kofleriaceae bacterium]
MTIYTNYALGLQLSHRVLTRNLHRFAAFDQADSLPADFGDYLRLFLEFLEVHHDGEERSLFPALRRNAAGRSTDAAHLDRWTSDHREIGRLHDELAKISSALTSADARGAVVVRSRDLLAVLQPHVDDEEAVLTPQRLAEMIPERELAAATDEVARANRSRALTMASFLATSLDPKEQASLFGNAPWLFRRVLLPISKRRMRRFHDIVQGGVA